MTRLLLLLWAVTLLAGLVLAGAGRLPVAPYAVWLAGLSWAMVRLWSRSLRERRSWRRRAGAGFSPGARGRRVGEGL